MKQIAHLLENKGKEVWSLPPDATVHAAISEMAKKEVGALLVMKGDELVGIVSERDYARKVILKGKASKETPVSDIMSHPVVCVQPEITVEQSMAIMTRKRIRHLPVTDKGKVIGVISIGDVVRGIIEDREFEIQQLTNYITGGTG